MVRYVVGFAFDKNFPLRVALIEKQHPEWQRGNLNGIGGRIEADEKDIDAMVREFKEETGCTTSPEDWTHTIILTGKGYEVVFYKATLDLANVKTMTDERVMHISVTDMSNYKLIDNLYWLLPIQLFDYTWPLHVYDKVPTEDGHKDESGL